MRETTTAIDRASPTDLAFLAMDDADLATQFGGLVVLGGDPLTSDELYRALASRLDRVPRLRQRLCPVRWGRGRPIWVDDADFDLAEHLTQLRCPAPGGERELLDLTAAVVSRPLPQSRPLWSGTLITGLAGGGSAVLLTVHHVLADGVTGLNLLLRLADPGPSGHEIPPWVPRPAPPPASLARDAAAGWVAAVGRLPLRLRQLHSSLAAGGGVHPPRVRPCSLLRPTGPSRRVVLVRRSRDGLARAAHAAGASVNDALLVAVAEALGRLLELRGEPRPSRVALAVPVSGHAGDPAAAAGNQASPLLVSVPVVSSRVARLRAVAAQTRRGRAGATGPPPIALLGPAFRMVARLGGYRWYLEHQRRLHSLVSHVRGPDDPIHIAGRPVVDVVPVAVGAAGNLTAAFDAVTYAGTLTVAVVVDPDRCPDAADLARELDRELARLATAAVVAAGPSRSGRVE